MLQVGGILSDESIDRSKWNEECFVKQFNITHIRLIDLLGQLDIKLWTNNNNGPIENIFYSKQLEISTDVSDDRRAYRLFVTDQKTKTLFTS